MAFQRLDRLARCVVIVFLLLPAAAPLRAAPRQAFPYETVVDAPETYVRSGPGSKYYPTGKLKQGDRVLVHRHDPGGWYMIAPPPGSFSWVPARYVHRASSGRGTVNANNVVVRVGSFESDIRELFSRTLSEGDDVEIIGEKVLSPETGGGEPELWYRITPPRGEWRWVSGQALAPAGSAAGRGDAPSDYPAPMAARRTTAQKLVPLPRAAADDADDFDPPVAAAQPREYLDAGRPDAGSADEANLAERPLVRRRSAAGASVRRDDAGKPAGLDAQLEELDRLDARYRSILERDPAEWDFAQLAADYRRLHAAAATANLRQMVDTRLLRIAGHEQTRAQQIELERTFQATLQRDAELAQAQQAHEARAAAFSQLRFDGAGIVQRAALRHPGAPRYVLLNPAGRVLAYLHPAPNVNLDLWVGRAAGVVGSREPNAALRADLITVRHVAAVHLAE